MWSLSWVSPTTSYIYRVLTIYSSSPIISVKPSGRPIQRMAQVFVQVMSLSRPGWSKVVSTSYNCVKLVPGKATDIAALARLLQTAPKYSVNNSGYRRTLGYNVAWHTNINYAIAMDILRVWPIHLYKCLKSPRHVELWQVSIACHIRHFVYLH